MAAIKKHDFVEMGYTARTKEDGAIFDTTEEKVAKESGLGEKGADYSPVIVCVGENSILKGLEDQIIGKETGKEYSIEIGAENAFGKRNAKLIQLIPTSKFRQQNIQPMPGLKLNIDGMFGIVKTVSGGRCMVDFNHPLAGKELVYNVSIKRIVEDDSEKLKSLLKMHLQLKDARVDVKEGAAAIQTKKSIPKEAQEEFKKIAGRTIPSIKSIVFTIPEEKK